MRRLLELYKRLFTPGKSVRPTTELLQETFRKRYAYFRSLLTANNNALQAMAELEMAYYGRESYRMPFIRSKVVAILVNVYKMIRSIDLMADGKYRELETVFDRISEAINGIIDRKPQFQPGPPVRALEELRRIDARQVGEKMACLGELTAISGLAVPPGFVLTSSATRQFLTDDHLAEINRRLQQLDPDDLDQLFRTCREVEDSILVRELPVDLEELLYHHYDRLEEAHGRGCRVALRSSATGEDSAGLSFAGLYRTVLNVERRTLVEAYKAIIASKYAAKAITYRRNRGYRHEDIEMCVGCLVMIDGVVSGVTYSRDPEVPGCQAMRINVTAGLAQGIVDGTGRSSRYLVSRDPPYEVLAIDDGAARQTVSALSGQPPVLTAAQIERLAEAALQSERHFGQAQDLEWSFDRQGRLFILQSRPLMVIEPGPEDNSSTAAQPEGEPFVCGGVAASGGVASGPVFKVVTEADMQRFPRGAVLVIEHPLPEWAPLLTRAVALVAENGSEAGHLATISREFGLPALFGAPAAMASLVNGETVTVDASRRAVFRGYRADLLRSLVEKRDIMAGSPVQRLLTEVLQQITPLNLLDPDSPWFKPSRCETLHDITRFCHEKAVTHMFRFGRGMHADGAARRLIGHIPLEWWVIDLADGIKPGTEMETGVVRIEDIDSQPMRAIWRGIAAVPWEGPPPVSVRGFGSIIFQSAMRPELDPAVPSRLTVKNYFLISRNFCNLSARLGYHYSMIEAYLSDLLTESYVTFRFKGGAADLKRKAIRARLLADILKHYDFRVELRSDALLARLKKQTAAYLESRLEVLGYLTLHARQLDMVMNRPHAVDQYREKFMIDIDTMLRHNQASEARDCGHENRETPAG